MRPSNIVLFLILLFISLSCISEQKSKMVGRFNVDKDLFIAHFDCKTDVDDVHSVAGVKTILSDPRLNGVKFHAVAGTYGIQEGLYVPANELFDSCYGNNWSDAHSNFHKALNEETELILETMNNGGKIWIAEAGQSDFTAAMVRNISNTTNDYDLKELINVVQHSEWNENMTDSINLKYVKANCSYHKIPDGNTVENGSPGLVTDDLKSLNKYMKNQKLSDIWNLAIETANKYNGKEERYNNPSIAKGGLDFSDVSETCWIFGFDYIKDVEQFFKDFSKN